jgi:hypothetical protein
MSAYNPRFNSSHLKYRYRRRTPIPAIVRMWEAEDEIVRRCAAVAKEFELACEVADAALKRRDIELSFAPTNAWIWPVFDHERADLAAALSQQARKQDVREAAEALVEELSHRVTGDELFLAAWKSFSHFRARRARR